MHYTNNTRSSKIQPIKEGLSMKFLFIIILLVSSFNSFAKEFLTNEQKRIVLAEIDNVCGDTWCEGDFNYEFTFLKCDDIKKSCTLEFSSYYHSDLESVEFNSCNVQTFTQFSDLITNTGELTQRFYETLTNDCF